MFYPGSHHLAKLTQAAEARREGRVTACLASPRPGQTGLLLWGVGATVYSPVGQCAFVLIHNFYFNKTKRFMISQTALG